MIIPFLLLHVSNKEIADEIRWPNAVERKQWLSTSHSFGGTLGLRMGHW